jgi:thiol-disulfide isomerase/thioredoxin/plasmid stability protein
MPTFSRSLLLALFFLTGCCLRVRAAGTSPEADHAWSEILTQAAGPGTRFPDQAAAMAAAKAHLEKQETALRDFIRHYPDDPRSYSARIRLSAVLSARARMTGPPSLKAEAQKILQDIESNPATPAPIAADAGFARVSQDMEDAARHTDAATREALLRDVRTFDAAHPADRRFAGLLDEVATLYDDDPAQKGALLAEAAARAQDVPLRKRIADDQRRLDLLGHPVEARLQPWQGGAPVELSALRGRVVVILFWASWSMPALHELAVMEKVAQGYKGQPVDFLTVSLDEDRSALEGTIKAANLTLPVDCDFHGWQGDLVRSLGINSLPTVWVLDRAGNLTALNARGEEPELIHDTLAKP